MKNKFGYDRQVKSQTPIITRPVSVDTLYDTDGMRFIVDFGFKLPKGTNNFDKLQAMLDQLIVTARNEISQKIANKLGVVINWEEKQEEPK